MAGELNGRDPMGRVELGHEGSPGRLRVTLVGPPAAAGAAEDRAEDRAAEDSSGDGASLELLDPPRGRLTVGDEHHDVLVSPLPDPRRAAIGASRIEVVVDGWRFEVDVESESRARLRDRAATGRGEARGGGPVELRAIIPGRVGSVDVAQGDEVEAGGRLLVVEAMKMQNELRAPRAGRIGQVAVGPGQTVELGDLLLVIE